MFKFLAKTILALSASAAFFSQTLCTTPAKAESTDRPNIVMIMVDESEQQWEGDRMETYAAMVDIVDENIGRLVAYLKEHDQYENTIILFCSDNGGCPFERTRRRDLPPWDPRSYWTYDAAWANASNTPFRLYKQNQHEGGISSPLIVHWPEGMKAEAGSVSREATHLIDMMPTFVELAGARYPESIGERKMEPLQGRSLLPIFRGERFQPHNQLYFHFGTDRALRQGDWKLVSAKLGRWELYNFAEDRTELNDLAAQYPERVESMAKEWRRVAEEVDRLKGNQLRPVKETKSKLSFRKDTSGQLKESSPSR